jgi:hypothetical protein
VASEIVQDHARGQQASLLEKLKDGLNGAANGDRVTTKLSHGWLLPAAAKCGARL